MKALLYDQETIRIQNGAVVGTLFFLSDLLKPSKSVGGILYKVYIRDTKKGFKLTKTVALTKSLEKLLKTIDKKRSSCCSGLNGLEFGYMLIMRKGTIYSIILEMY